MPELNDLMTVDEVAARTRINRKTIHAMIKRGELPGVKRFGSKIRVFRTTLEHWLAEDVRRTA